MTGQPAYTDADVQAAARVLSGRETTTGRDRREAAAVLDAIAPAIAARALREFADNRVHFQTAGRMQEDLHARADEIEAGR